MVRMCPKDHQTPAKLLEYTQGWEKRLKWAFRSLAGCSRYKAHTLRVVHSIFSHGVITPDLCTAWPVVQASSIPLVFQSTVSLVRVEK